MRISATHCWAADLFAARSLQPSARSGSIGILFVISFLLLLVACPPAAQAQVDCVNSPVPPGWAAIIWLPGAQFPNYVGGQVTPWYLTINWTSFCPNSVITVKTDNGQPGPLTTLLTLPLNGSSGNYDNGSPLVGGPLPNGGFPSPPPVGGNTPWNIYLIGTVNGDPNNTSSSTTTITLLPLQMSLQLSDNKIVAAPGASTVATVSMDADPSPAWFPTHNVQSTNPDVTVSYTWPDGAATIPISLSDSQTETASSPETVTAEIDSSNGIVVTASAQLTVQPPGDPGTCDDEPCENTVGLPINLGTGNVWITEKDYSIPGLGGGLQLTRTWNSLWQSLAPPTVAGLFGQSWRSNFEEQLVFPDANSVTYYRSDGSSWVFALNGAVTQQFWSLVSPGNVHANLTNSNSQWTLILPDGTRRIFSQSGQLQAMVDRNSNQTTLSYDTSNRLIAVTDAAGQSIAFTYTDPNNTAQATSVQDSVGVIASYAYDSSSRLVQVTYADGSSLNFTYGANSMITSVTDGMGKVLEAHTYDSANRGITSSRANGADALSVDFSTPGQPLLTDSLGNTTTYGATYTGGRMRVNSVTGPGCASCGGRGTNSFTYDIAGERTASTDALGNLTCYTYNFGSGEIASKSLNPPGGSCSPVEVGQVFRGRPTANMRYREARSFRRERKHKNANYILASQKSSAPLAVRAAAASTGGNSASSPTCTPSSNATQVCSMGHASSSASSAAKAAVGLRPNPSFVGGGGGSNGVTWKYFYNNFQEVTSVTDPAGNQTFNNYDANGNLLSTITPSPDGVNPGSTTSFVYDTFGDLTQITDPNGNVTTMTYTPAGLVASIADAQGHVTAFTYDARGNRLTSTDAMSQTTNLIYDVMNRLTKVVAPDGSSTSTGYDYRGRRTSVTDANGKTTSYQYDDANRLTAVTDPAGHATSYAYNTENELTGVTDAAGHTTSSTYDPLGHVTQVTFPSSLTESYSYDADENLLSKTDRKGQTISYIYDFRNRLTSKSYPNGTGVSYTYDVLSHLTQAADPTGTYSFTYDNMGRLTSTSTQYAFLSGQTLTNGYAYDANSNRVSFTNPQGGVDSYVYDSLNRLTSLTDFAGRLFTLSYDALGRRTGLSRPNGVNSSYTYDPLSRLLSVLHQAGSSTIDGTDYTYDAAGNRTSKTALPSNVTSSYTYDPAYELTQVMQGTKKTEAYTYDAAGNRMYQPGAPYAYNSSNEMLTREGVPYTYDANGNTLSKTNKSGTTSYAWDFENRLTSVTLTTGGVLSMMYDPFGRRINKITPVGETTYVYDGDNIEEELNGSPGTLSERFTYGPGVDGPLVGQRQPQVYFYEADGLGSVTSLTDPTGVVSATYAYDSFGFQTNGTGNATNWFRYTGRELDSDTGLDYYRARYYDPMSGRFLSEDPARYRGGLNFYVYVRNNPPDLVDPSGRCPTKDPQLISCDTALPNGQTVGDVVRQERAVLQNVFDTTMQANQSGADSDPLLAITGKMLSIGWPKGPIDFKRNYKGQADPVVLGEAGNFAYYAIGSGYLPTLELDAGATAYAILAHGSLSSPDAQAVRDAALAANGCQ